MQQQAIPSRLVVPKRTAELLPAFGVLRRNQEATIEECVSLLYLCRLASCDCADGWSTRCDVEILRLSGGVATAAPLRGVPGHRGRLSLHHLRLAAAKLYAGIIVIPHPPFGENRIEELYDNCQGTPLSGQQTQQARRTISIPNCRVR